MTGTPTPALPVDVDTAADAARRWIDETHSAAQRAADAREQLATVELHDPDAAFELMSTIETADRRAAAAVALAATATNRHAAARVEQTIQYGHELRAAAAELWGQWRDHKQAGMALLDRLNAHEGAAYQLPRLHERTRSEEMLETARAADAAAAETIVQAGGCYAVARSGPVVNGEREVHVGYDAPRNDHAEQPGMDLGTLAQTQISVRRRHTFDVAVDGRPWPGGSLQTSHTTFGIDWVVRPLPASATVTVTSRTTGQSFTLPPAELELP